MRKLTEIHVSFIWRGKHLATPKPARPRPVLRATAPTTRHTRPRLRALTSHISARHRAPRHSTRSACLVCLRATASTARLRQHARNGMQPRATHAHACARLRRTFLPACAQRHATTRHTRPRLRALTSHISARLRTKACNRAPTSLRAVLDKNDSKNDRREAEVKFRVQ